MSETPAAHDRPLANLSLLPAVTDDGEKPRDAIRILIPGDGAAASVAYRSDECSERSAFVRAPMVAVIPLGQACRIQCKPAGETLMLEIGMGFFEQQVRATLGGEAPRLAAAHASIDSFIREIGNALRSELLHGHPVTGAALEPLTALIVLHLARHYAASAVIAAPAPSLPQHKLKRVQVYVEHHLSESIRVEQLAAEAHMSPYHFARMFKRATGQPPHLYVVLRRVEHAKALLRDSDLALVDLAAQAGFCTQCHFTSVFHRYVGCTPLVFRLNCRANQPA
jgi:AraC family transcriptional regulator